MKVNFELATPNSVRGCTLALPTWCRMKKGAGVHCARAVHVQIFCTCSSFAAPTGQTVRAADAKLAGTHACFPSIYVFVVAVRMGCRLRATRPEKFIREGSSGSGKFLAIDTKFGTLIKFDKRNSMVHAIS